MHSFFIQIYLHKKFYEGFVGVEFTYPIQLHILTNTNTMCTLILILTHLLSKMSALISS